MKSKSFYFAVTFNSLASAPALNLIKHDAPVYIHDSVSTIAHT